MNERGKVTQIYDVDPEHEWRRLDRRRIEFGVTQLALKEFLPKPPARVLDIGSGPGRYALSLAQQGFSVSLVDLSVECLRFANSKAEEAGVSFDALVEGSATHLTSFRASSFDAVLLMGPLYHLRSCDDRKAAVQEALRVLKPGGVLFSAFLNRYSAVRFAAKARPAQLYESPALLESILSTGVTDSSRADASFLATCYFYDPLEIRPFMHEQGVLALEVVGCEGVVAEVEERLNSLSAEQLEPWLEINYRLGRREELQAGAAHLLHVGQKPLP